jgi:flagellar hook-length control protein FliK
MNALALSLTQNNMAAAPSAGADGAPLDPGATGIDFAALVALELSNAQTGAALPEDSQTPRLSAESPSDPQPDAEAFGSLVGLGLNSTPANPTVREESPSDSRATDSTLDARPGVEAPGLVVPAAQPSTKALEPLTADAPPSTVVPGSQTTSADYPVAPQAPLSNEPQLPRASAQVQADVEQVAPHPRTASENAPAATTAIADDAANIAARGETPVPAAHPTSAPFDIAKHAASDHDRQALSSTQTTPKPEAIANTVLVQPAESRPPAPQPSALLEVAAPVSEPGFADALSRQVVWMVGKDAQVAELRINPPELGPVQVRLTLNGDDAAAHFISAHAEVREAIENAIARLRETLAQTGIQLGDTSVSAESFTDQAGKQANGHLPHHHGYRDEHSSSDAARQGLPATTIAKRGLVDVFA